MKILHITNWYPHQENLSEALWIERQISLLENSYENEIWHIESKHGKKYSLSRKNIESNHLISPSYTFRLTLPINKWLFHELIVYRILKRQLQKQKKRVNSFDIVIVHIAYPLLLHWEKLKKYIEVPVVISEHWSAYHFNFGLNQPVKKIQNIFSHKIPLITVSDALAEDIKKYSGFSDFKCFILPNIVDSSIFKPLETKPTDTITFFMVSNWKYPKKPIIVIKAIKELIKEGHDIQLKVAGYGEQKHDILKEIHSDDRINWLGKLTSEEIANEMNKASAFLHCSDYETFSVVCLESLFTGTPVIASKVGGIQEFVNLSNGYLVEKNNVYDWVKTIKDFIDSKDNFSSQKISSYATELYSKNKIKEKYALLFSEICN